jgi:PAS domain S-box-containing protein
MEKALAGILMSLPDIAVATVDSGENVVMFSPGFRQLLGDVDPKNLTDLMRAVPLYDGERPLTLQERPLFRASGGHIVRDLVAAAQHTDGTWRYLRFNAAPMRGNGDTIRGAITLVQDITAEHRQYQHQAKLRADLITTINHHFRTPLSLVLGHAEILEDFRIDLPPQVQRSIEALTRGAKTLQNLTRAVSELVELDSAHDLDLTTLDICQHLQHVLTGHQHAAAEAGVCLRFEGPEHYELCCDPILIERAVGALLDNAVQHAPAGTTVTLEVGPRPNGVGVAVVDTGYGIPVHDLERLLQPFETGTQTDDAEGRGLGLSLAHTIVAAHGGTLTLTPNDPTGLRAELIIPEPADHAGRLGLRIGEHMPPPASVPGRGRGL